MGGLDTTSDPLLLEYNYISIPIWLCSKIGIEISIRYIYLSSSVYLSPSLYPFHSLQKFRLILTQRKQDLWQFLIPRYILQHTDDCNVAQTKMNHRTFFLIILVYLLVSLFIDWQCKWCSTISGFEVIFPHCRESLIITMSFLIRSLSYDRLYGSFNFWLSDSNLIISMFSAYVLASSCHHQSTKYMRNSVWNTALLSPLQPTECYHFV